MIWAQTHLLLVAGAPAAYSSQGPAVDLENSDQTVVAAKPKMLTICGLRSISVATFRQSSALRNRGSSNSPGLNASHKWLGNACKVILNYASYHLFPSVPQGNPPKAPVMGSFSIKFSALGTPSAECRRWPLLQRWNCTVVAVLSIYPSLRTMMRRGARRTRMWES